MQLKIKRSEHMGGFLGNTNVYTLDVQLELTDEEYAQFKRRKFDDKYVYDSRDKGGHSDKYVLIFPNDLLRGKSYDFDSLGAVAAAEVAITEQCKTWQTALRVAGTFDGGERVISFGDDGATVIAETERPPPLMQPSVHRNRAADLDRARMNKIVITIVTVVGLLLFVAFCQYVVERV